MSYACVSMHRSRCSGSSVRIGWHDPGACAHCAWEPGGAWGLRMMSHDACQHWLSLCVMQQLLCQITFLQRGLLLTAWRLRWTQSSHLGASYKLRLHESNAKHVATCLPECSLLAMVHMTCHALNHDRAHWASWSGQTGALSVLRSQIAVCPVCT